jgi:hypothetical protein
MYLHKITQKITGFYLRLILREIEIFIIPLNLAGLEPQIFLKRYFNKF